APQGAGTLSNSQCSINVSQSSFSGSGLQLTVTVSVTFQSSFAGTKNNYLIAFDQAGLNSGWQQVGTWTVPGSGPGGPTITNLSPNAGPVGTPVTITGTNFGSSQGTSTVIFNGTNAGTATSWSASSIAVNVPNGATTGNVVVRVNGVPSNGVTFTVTAGAVT